VPLLDDYLGLRTTKTAARNAAAKPSRRSASLDRPPDNVTRNPEALPGCFADASENDHV
jgi:hypothetical protein